jgi:glycerol-3-phosphate dehydrogenase subunit C
MISFFVAFATTLKAAMKTKLDWSAYDNYGLGDAYAQIPTEGGAYGKAAAVCIGNRQCQREDKGVMCPSYRITQDVAHSTQHRAATLKAALNGDYGTKPFISPEVETAMELCVACKGCKRECPNGVDMAMLRNEALAQRWETLGKVPLREKLFANIPLYAKHRQWLNRFSLLWARVPLLRKLIEKTLGISAKRSLPKAAIMDFLSLKLPPQQTVPAEAREVVLLVDTFSNHFDTDIATSALALLQAGGYHVHIAKPDAGERALCCGRTYLSSGMIDEAKREAERMVKALLPYAERGLPIIGLEPSCLLMFRDEYYMLELGEGVDSMAKSALLLEEFLAREHDAKRLNLDFNPLPKHMLVHGHCHQKAFGAMKAMRKVLDLVPELTVEFIESSCCGMAGAFGMEAEHFEDSMKMANLSLLPQIRAAEDDTLLVANGTSCRHQIKDGVSRQAHHIAQVLYASLKQKEEI